MVGGLLCLGALFSPAAALAACEPLPSDKGQVSGSVQIETAGEYTLWVRLYVPATETDSVLAQVGDQCSIAMGDTNSGTGLRWVSVNAATSSPTRVTLAPGTHAVTLAGRETGAGVDKVLLLGDPACTPVGAGDNCGVATTVTSNADDKTGGTPESTKAAAKSDAPNWKLVGASLTLGVSTIAFVVWQYLRHNQRMMLRGELLITGMLHAEADLWQKVRHFVTRNPLTVAVCIVLVLVSLTVGIVAASATAAGFEAEDGKLSGSAKAVDDKDASGGKYVLFDKAVGGSSGGGSQPGGSGSSGGSSGSSGGSSGGSQPSGGSTPTATSCDLPKYPISSCTGVPAGWTPATTVNGNLVITEAFIAAKPNRTLENYLVTGTIDVRANNVTIKKTRAYGSIDNFVTSTIYGPLTIEDSEIVLPPGQTESGNYDFSIGVSNYTCTRCKVVGRAEAWRIGASSYPGNGPVTIKHSYAKLQVTPAQCAADDPHGDGIQGYGANFATIEHNTIDQRDDPCPTGPLFIPDQDNAGANVKDNLLAGGGYSMTLLGGSFPTVTGNKIAHASYGYGPVDVDCSLIGTWSGNARVNVDWSLGTITGVVAVLNDC
jgi:hypothetical protein